MKKEHHLSSSDDKHRAARRPFGVTYVIVVVLIFASLNALRMITAIRNWDFLDKSSVVVPVIYFVITGAVWMGIGIILVLGLLTRQKWSPSMAQITLVLYMCYYWVDRLFIADRSAIVNRWQFALGSTIVLFCSMFWAVTRIKKQSA
jgi:hypothetical protein